MGRFLLFAFAVAVSLVAYFGSVAKNQSFLPVITLGEPSTAGTIPTTSPEPTATPEPTTSSEPTAAPDPVSTATPTETPTVDADPTPTPIVPNGANSVCRGENDFSQIPAAYLPALTKYTTLNTEYLVVVCTQDVNGDNVADYMVVESTDMPEHESVYYPAGHDHHEEYDFETNVHKFAEVYDGQAAHSAGRNMIEQQTVVMKMPIAPREATNKTATPYGTIGVALNGVSFFNEAAAPGDEITDELFTFDQCSGHPQQNGVYHYHVDPVCLIRDLGGDIVHESANGYEWIADAGSNAELLLGFLVDGFAVYGPLGNGEVDCNGTAVTEALDQYNGHQHCTTDFPDGIYHYHVKTANHGGTGGPIFWITNQVYFGEPGIMGR